MKLSVYTLVCPEYSLSEAAAGVARHGIPGIEWRVGRAGSDADFDPRDPQRFWKANRATLPADDLANAAREAAKITADSGLEASFLAGNVQPGDLDALKLHLEAARTLGAPAIRVGTGGPEDEDLGRAFDVARGSWDAVEKLASEAGVKAVVEIHHFSLMPSASAARRFMDGRDPACCGVLYDPGNMAFEGYERPDYALQMIRPWLAHVHVKSARPRVTGADERQCLKWQLDSCGLREGIVDWAAQVEALKACGYSGYLSLEDFNAATQAEEKLGDFADLFRDLLAD